MLVIEGRLSRIFKASHVQAINITKATTMSLRIDNHTHTTTNGQASKAQIESNRIDSDFAPNSHIHRNQTRWMLTALNRDRFVRWLICEISLRVFVIVRFKVARNHAKEKHNLLIFLLDAIWWVKSSSTKNILLNERWWHWMKTSFQHSICATMSMHNTFACDSIKSRERWMYHRWTYCDYISKIIVLGVVVHMGCTSNHTQTHQFYMWIFLSRNVNEKELPKVFICDWIFYMPLNYHYALLKIGINATLLHSSTSAANVKRW